MIRALALIACLLAPLPVAAGPAPLAAVGRLELAGSGSCSGALVAPDLVLTAAHCLMGEVGGEVLEAARIAFRPGRSPGRPPPDAVAGRLVAVHPIYGFGIGPRNARMGFDFGLLRLAAPVPPEVALPLPLGALPVLGEHVVIAGYRGGAGEVARQRRCEVIEANHAFAALGCEVDGGESGSPMLRVGAVGPEIVGVLANKGRIEDQPVGFGPVTETGFDTVAEYLDSLEALDRERKAAGLDAAN